MERRRRAKNYRLPAVQTVSTLSPITGAQPCVARYPVHATPGAVRSTVPAGRCRCRYGPADRSIPGWSGASTACTLPDGGFVLLGMVTWSANLVAAFGVAAIHTRPPIRPVPVPRVPTYVGQCAYCQDSTSLSRSRQQPVGNMSSNES